MHDFECDIEIFKKILDTLPNSIYIKDLHGRYIWLNQASLKQLGYKHRVVDSIIGKTDFDVFPQANAKEYARNDKLVIESRQGICSEEAVDLPTGEQLIQLSFKEPLYIRDNDLIGVLGYTVDITAIKKKEAEILQEKEKAEAANKAKTEFLENMRHDIRTPLTGIVGFAELIKSEVSNPKIKEYVDNLTASSNALLDLLNSVLEVIAVDSGDIPILKKKFNVREKLHSVISLNQAKAHAKGLDLSFDFDKCIPDFLIGDSTRLHRVALELVTNALNFTNAGCVHVSVQLVKNNERDVIIKMIVEDTGVGIESEEQQKIYLQFKRLTPSYKGVYKGLGLGLFIAKQFVEDMDGELYLESQVGIGSKFTVVLQLKKSLLDDSSCSEDLVLLDTDNNFTKKGGVGSVASGGVQVEAYQMTSRILVVEDNDIVGRVLSNMLSGLNCQVEIAKEGELAVQLASANTYDLIFMDIGLPDIDGYEVTKRIRQVEWYKKNHVPIVALTAHIDSDSQQRCIHVGINALITKPLVQEKAKDILDSFVSHRKRAKL